MFVSEHIELMTAAEGDTVERGHNKSYVAVVVFESQCDEEARLGQSQMKKRI